MMHICCSLVTATLWATSLASDETFSSFKYVGWLKNETYEIRVNAVNSTTGWIIFGGDGYIPADFCDLESEYHCFFSQRLAFSVPKKGVIANSWYVREHQFKVVERNLSVSLLGRKISDLYLIVSPASSTRAGMQSQKPTYWLYSEEIGIIGFGEDVIPDEKSSVYWLENHAGYGPTSN